MKTARSIPQYTTILSQAMSPCGNLYVSATIDGYIGVWRISELFTTDASPFVRFKINGCIFSLQSSSRFLLVGERDRVTGYDWDSLSDGDNEKVPQWCVDFQGCGEVNSMVLSSQDDRMLVLGMGNNNVYLVDMETGTRSGCRTGHTSYVHSVDSCDNTIVSGGEDGCVLFWDYRNSDQTHCIKPMENSDLSRPKIGNYISSVALTSDWLACGGGPAPALWHLKAMSMSSTLPCSNSEVKVVKIHDESVMVAGRGRTLNLSNLSGELKAEIEMSSSVIYSLVEKSNPNVMCCAGSSSYVDILTNNFTYKDATINFSFEE